MLTRQTEKFWDLLGILLLTYLAPEFQKVATSNDKKTQENSTGDTVCVVILCSDTKVPIKVNILNHEKNGPKGHKKPVAGRKP